MPACGPGEGREAGRAGSPSHVRMRQASALRALRALRFVVGFARVPMGSPFHEKLCLVPAPLKRMKTSPVFVSLFVLSLVVAGPLVAGAEQAPKAEEKEKEKQAAAEAVTEAGFKLMEAERLGKLRYEMKAKEVVELCGKAASKGKVELWEAVGLHVQEWKYPELGLELQMSAEKKGGEQSVFMISATKPCKLATTRGIHLGSTEKEVVEAYGELKGEESEPGKTFVAGSMVGGVIFTFKDDLVVEIFIGAASE